MYLTTRLYRLLLLSGLLCLAGYVWTPFLWVGQIGGIGTLGFLLLEGVLLWRAGRNVVEGGRVLPSRFSHGDTHIIKLHMQHRYPFSIHLTLIDEIPEQFARADAMHRQWLSSGETAVFSYELRPLFRGEYSFGKLLAWINSPVGLIQRRHILAGKAVVPTYPSFRRLRQYSLQSRTDRRQQSGQQALRLGSQQQEFEHIKPYVRGDDVRTLNWKATARQRRLMVNQYQDARARSVYCLIDQSQMMEQTWEEISFLDHAINAAVMIAYVALARQDRVGIATFEAKSGPWLPPQNRPAQVQRILEHLYKLEPTEGIADFERLYATVRQKIPQRSTLILFTHFTHQTHLDRQLPALTRLAAHHQVLVVCFEPMEIHSLLRETPGNAHGLRMQTLARKRLQAHQALIHTLRHRGIPALSCKPDDLRLQTLNRYLRLRKS